jgi:hypothetical protein
MDDNGGHPAMACEVWKTSVLGLGHGRGGQDTYILCGSPHKPTFSIYGRKGS